MRAKVELLCCTALRLKQGELNGVSALEPFIADSLLPRFIVPPRKERDPNQPQLMLNDEEPDVGGVLSRHWYGRDALIDVTHIIDEYGRDKIINWFPRMIARARRAGACPIPMAYLSDLGIREAPAFASAIDRRAKLQFAFCVRYYEIESTEFRKSLQLALERLKVSPESCAIVADYGEADVSSPDVMAPIIRGAVDDLQDLGKWQYIIFQGAHFPEKNPAAPGGNILLPRNDWKAWKLVAGGDQSEAAQLMFGDYAADCAKISFAGRGKAIPHYRYATEEGCLVERGGDKGSHGKNMRDVANRIVNSGFFAGSGFSSADKLIMQTARGGPSGTASTWRQINITHHITRVVKDVLALRGVKVEEKVTDLVSEQQNLFGEDESVN